MTVLHRTVTVMWRSPSHSSDGLVTSRWQMSDSCAVKASQVVLTVCVFSVSDLMVLYFRQYCARFSDVILQTGHVRQYRLLDPSLKAVSVLVYSRVIPNQPWSSPIHPLRRRTFGLWKLLSIRLWKMKEMVIWMSMETSFLESYGTHALFICLQSLEPLVPQPPMRRATPLGSSCLWHLEG